MVEEEGACRRVAIAAEGATAVLVEVVTTAMAPHRQADHQARVVDMGNLLGEVTVHPSIVGVVMARRHGVSEAEVVEHRRHRQTTRPTKAHMTTMTGGLQRDHMALDRTVRDSSRPARHLLRATGTKGGTMRITPRTISLAPNPLRLFLASMMVLLTGRQWRWMQLQGAKGAKGTESGIVMLMLRACWLCNKQEHQRVPTAKMSKSTLHQVRMWTIEFVLTM